MPPSPDNQRIDLHEGTIDYKNKKIFWKENGASGAIEFNLNLKKKGNPLLSLVEAANALEGDSSEVAQKTVQLNLVNKLLAHFRPHANPDNNKYYAAAAGVDKLGQLYIAVNNEHAIKQAFEGRGCAETLMLGRYQQKNHLNQDRSEQAEFKSLYLMSGKVKSDAYRGAGELTDDHPGAIACLCGECRRNMRPHMDNGVGGRFIMVPTNDGKVELTINSTAKTIGDLKVGEAWELTPEMMYPLPKTKPYAPETTGIVLAGYQRFQSNEAMPPLKNGFNNVKVSKGYTRITKAHLAALVDVYENSAPDVSALRLWPKLELENVNRTLLQRIKLAYDEHKENVPPEKNLQVTAIIVKSNENPPKFYPSIFVEGEDWLPSKPNRYAVALSNANNRRGVSDIYAMQFDLNKLRTLEQQARDGEAIYHEAMPDPAELGRVLKNMKKDDQTKIHIIPVNNGTLNEEALKKIMLVPIKVREDFGPGYDHPKKGVASAL
jgi:cytidine deaminase